MRRVCAWELVSVEGVMETPEEWAFPYSNAEMEQASASGMAASDALLLGRVTYEHLATYWPDQPGSHACSIRRKLEAAEIPAKRRYRREELRRWAEH